MFPESRAHFQSCPVYSVEHSDGAYFYCRGNMHQSWNSALLQRTSVQGLRASARCRGQCYTVLTMLSLKCKKRECAGYYDMLITGWDKADDIVHKTIILLHCTLSTVNPFNLWQSQSLFSVYVTFPISRPVLDANLGQPTNYSYIFASVW